MQRDIQMAKSFGLNGARKHQKVEDPRWLYWCDKLGFIVWGEMANAYDYSDVYVSRMLEPEKAGPALAGTISQWSRVIGDFVEANFDRAPFTLALDRLDDGWDAKLKVLFDYSIVGVPRRGGSEGGTTFQFNFHDRLLEPNFDQDVTVHPALKKHLKLTEGQ